MNASRDWRPQPGEFNAHARTHRGLKRRHNEDTYLCQPQKGRFAVIDGLGGANAGEVAAEMARQALQTIPDLPQAILTANQRIVEAGQKNPDQRGMGCVLTAAQVDGDRLRIAHVGDTRAYLAREGGCRLLTRDHTAVAEEQDRRILSEAEARALPGQNRVTRDLGGSRWSDTSQIDVSDVAFKPGDLLLMCSDGLHDLVPSSELSEILRRARAESTDPERLTRSLQELALERGGKDNVTVLIARREAAASGGAAKKRRWIRWFAAAFVAFTIGAAALAWWVVERDVLAGIEGWSELDGVEERPALLRSAARKAAIGLTGASDLVAAGPAGLDGELRPAVLTPLGPLEAAPGLQTTRVMPPLGLGAQRCPDEGCPAVSVRGMELLPPAEGAASWQIAVDERAGLELRQASIRAPEMHVAITLAGGASLRILDSHLDVASLTVTGGEIAITGGQLRVGGQIEPAIDGVARIDGPAPSAPEENAVTDTGSGE